MFHGRPANVFMKSTYLRSLAEVLMLVHTILLEVNQKVDIKPYCGYY